MTAHDMSSFAWRCKFTTIYDSTQYVLIRTSSFCKA
jgi:hypothetical protein